MKNFKLNRTPIDIGVKKKHLFIKKLLVLLVVLITCIPQVWADTKRVYFKNTSSWSSVYIHTWGSGASTEWPGIQMTQIPNTAYYYADVNDWNTDCKIHNNSGTDTGDLNSLPANQVYVLSETTWRTFGTVYYAVPSATVGSYTVKLNIAHCGDCGDNKKPGYWEQNTMNKISGSYDGYDIYEGVFYDVYNGAGTIQFQLYDGGTHKSQQQPISSWTGLSTFNGKLYKHDEAGWHTLAYDHTANVFAGSNGDVSPKGASTTINATGTSISATPDSHYAFIGWTISGGGISPSSSTTSPQTFTATSDGGSIQANFAPKWAIKGGDTESSDGTSDKMGNWSTYKNFASTGEANMYSQTITLDANETYRFKVIERGGTDTYYGFGTNDSNNDVLTFIGQSGSQVISTGNNHNLVLMTAGAGSYTFTWNSNTHALEVTYPTVDHPCSDYVYFKDYYNWDRDHGDILAHIWGGSCSTGSNKMPHVGSFTFDGTTYYYAALGDNNTCMFAGSDNTSTYKTEDLNSASSKKGKYYDFSSANSEASRWQDFKVLITLDNQAATSAGTESVNPIYKSTVLSDISVPSKSNYTFGGYYTAEGGSGTQLINASGVWQQQSGYTDASKHWTRKESVTLYAKWTQTVTLSHTDASSGPSNPSVVYNTVPADITLPVRSGFGFDGYWTESGGNGIQVIDETGKWKKDVAYHTDANGKWTRSDATTLYARWLPNGYYMVGGFNNWTADPSYHKFDGTTHKVSFGLSKSDFTSTPIKVRKVNENTSTWYGKGASDGANSIGKATPSITGLTSTGARITLQVYYTGTYEFEMSEGDGTIDLTVTVPVVNRLEFYNINGYTDGNTDDPVEGHDLPWLTDNFSEVDANTVTKTETLHRGSYYYFKPVYDSEYYGKGTGDGNNTTITRNSNTTVSGLDDDGGLNTLRINADLTGDYTFDFNHSTKTLTVTYPTKCIINYSAVTLKAGTGESAAPTAKNNDDADYALASKDSVVSGNSVTFSAKTANTGYTFRGWFSKNNPSSWTDGRLATTADYTVTIDADKTVYAVYSEDTLTVTVNATTGGSITTPSGSGSTVDAHPATGATIVAAKADEGWHFTGWTSASDKVTFADEHALTTTVTTTENATIQANFVRRYALYGSRDNGSDPDTKSGLPGWSPNEPVDFTGTVTTLGTADGANLTYAATLEPNKKYKFQVYDRALSKYRGATSADAVLPAEGEYNWELNEPTSPKDVHINTVGYGTYTFHITKISNDDDRYPSIQVDRQSSKQLTLGKKVIYNDDNSSLTNADTEGTVTAKVVENEPETGTLTDYFLTSGQYYADGSDITFAAEAATGYKIVGWYSDVSCSTPYEHDGSTIIISTNGAKTESTLVLKNCTTAKTVYVKFEEIMTYVILSTKNGAGHVEIGGETVPLGVNVGVHTTFSITGVPNEGYYFAGWEERDDAGKCSVTGYTEDDRTTTLSGAGTSDAYATTLYAIFEQLDVIYFKNLVNWTNVYVYFNPTWGEAKDPAWSPGVYPKDAGCTCVLMSGTGDYRYAYIPRKYSRAGSADILRRVAFSDVDMHDYTNFSGNNAVYRQDWNEKLDTYVPAANGTGGATSIGTGAPSFNGTTYYNEGYWMERSPKADEGIGYYIKCDALSVDVQFTSQASGYNMGVAKVRIDDVSTARTFYVASLQSTIYAGSGSITSLTTDPSTLYYYNSGTGSLSVEFTAEGDYTFYLYQDGAHMTLKVDYPVSPGDYRLLYTYDDGAKTRASDPIKKNALSAIQQDTVSMYIDPTVVGNSLVLQKCTSINEDTKLPEWSTGVSVGTLSSLFTVDVEGTPTATKGVYYFAVNIDNTGKDVDEEVESVELADIKPYAGKFYIKTNCANGGWTNYKRNALNKNSLNPTAFDYYFCIYLNSTTTNVKCVIANDYSNQISDTLVSDAILTREVAGKDIAYETLPEAGSVRFSFNSKTCELKRTYMLGSSSGSSFLFIVSNDNDMVYATDGTTDLHDLAEDNAGRKFTDLGNWVYELDVMTYPTAVAGVQTKYPSFGEINYQTLIPLNNTLIGGDAKGSTQYEIHLVYDFKTEYLMAAWTPTGAITTAIEDVDVLLARHGQDAGKTITFGVGGSLDAKKVIGALEFQYNELVGHVGGSWNQDIRELLMHFISFPFDVNVRDVFGFTGSYGYDWVIRKYNGAKRAEKGFFLGDGISTFWEDLTMDSVMHAGEGYCVVLDNDYVNSGSSSCWTNKTSESSIYMYFPSATEVGNVATTTATIKVPAHECKHDRPFINQHDQEVNHKYTDSHWNLMGVPLFTNQSGTESGTPGDIFIYPEEEDPSVMRYYYKWDTEDNVYEIANAAAETFKTMHSYMVQYHGDVKFTGTRPAPASVAARRTPLRGNYKLELQVLNANEKVLNRAFVELRENACDTFELNEDVYMSPNSRAVILYTLAGNYDVAANVLSINNHIVQVGMNVKKAGTYTFAMPSNFSGTVTLIDTYTDTRTNLAMGNYTVNLPKGLNNDRFQLEINISNAPTAIDGAEAGQGSLKDGKAHKFIQNGVMYILENGRLYDARGNRVK